MKKLFTLLSLSCVLLSCMPTTRITGEWKNPKQLPKNYSSIFIASLSSNNVARATVEADMAIALEKENIKTYKSMDEFPPGIKKDSMSKEKILSKVKNKKTDGILTISLIRKETESRYVPGGNPYQPFPRYPYYSDFSGYYSFWSPYMYSPSYYENNKIYYLETNLYDAASEQLIWSAQSKTYNPESLQSFSKEFSKLIVEKIKASGMLKPANNP